MKAFRAYLILGFVLTSGLAQLWAGANADSIELNHEDLSITVHVFNSARIARDELTQAEREATNILAQANVRIIWDDCAVSIKNIPAQRPCTGLYDSKNLFLDIQPWSMVKRLGLNATMLGACTASTDGGSHNQALVSYGTVEFLAFQWNIERARILGTASAHEIGHLLLRQNSHSKLGIMRSEFQKEDFQYFNLRHLRFSDEQAQAMQAEVLAQFSRSKSSYMH